MILYTCSKGMAGKENKMNGENEMTTSEFKTIIEMIIMIVESCKDKEEVLEKLKNLSIIKNK